MCRACNLVPIRPYVRGEDPKYDAFLDSLTPEQEKELLAPTTEAIENLVAEMALRMFGPPSPGTLDPWNVYGKKRA